MQHPNIHIPTRLKRLCTPFHALSYRVRQTSAVKWCTNRWRRLERRFGRLRLRVTAGSLAVIMLLAACLPAIQQLGVGRYYSLDSSTLQLVGKTDASLAKQLSYDAEDQEYVFNKDVVTAAASQTAENPLAQLQASVGAKDKSNAKTYALTVPEDFSQGVTYYDANSNLSFKLVPQFSAMDARTEQGHIVFPMSGDRQAIYTLKNNGLKEDIVLPSPTNDAETYSYTFDLPKSLAVRIIPDSGGAIGIYSADPALFGNVSYATDADRAKVEKARETAEKTNLVFALPAPVITSVNGKGIGNASARFELRGDELSVVAENLKSAGNQPLSIDPSVVITSTTDFEFGGNDEGNIDFSTSGQVTRGALTGGDTGTWASTTSFDHNLEQSSSVFYDGYLYVVRGIDREPTPDLWYNTVSYVQVNSDGTLGTWGTTTALPTAGLRGSVVAYNGYLYNIGGKIYGNTISTDAYYAHINSDGSIGSWQDTTDLPVARYASGVATSGGYVYILGGADTTSLFGNSNVVYYARLWPSGAIGAWDTTTQLSYVRGMMSAQTYNGYLYIFGGTNSSTFVADVQYAKINANGTLGSWMTTSSFTGNRYGHISAFYNGYVYLYGGWLGSSYPTTLQYAPVNANGSLGTWVTSASNFTTGRAYVVGGAYKGYLYIGTGATGGPTTYSDFQYAKIQPQGKTAAFTNGSGFTTNRRYSQTVAIYGRMYIIGGDAGSTASTAIGYMSINATTGALSSYTTTGVTQLGTGRMLFGAFAYNGYMYVLGGCSSALTSCDTAGNALSTVYSATIDASSGNIGTWASQTSFTTARYSFATAFYNGYVYIMGGTASGGGSPLNSIEYAGFANGTVNSWTTASPTYNLPAGLTNMAYATNGNNVYLAGGCTSGTAASCSGQTNAVYHIKLSASGGLASTWATDTSFTTARYGARMTAVNGVLYLVGGYDGTNYYADVQYALIGSDSSVSAWQTGNSTTISQMGASVATQNGMLYVIGGYNGSYQNITNFANTNNGGRGQAGTWTTNGTSMSGVYSSGLGYARSVAVGGYVYVIGGTDGSVRATVAYASLSTDGSVGSWSTTSSLQTARYQHAVLTYNGYIYALGGQTTGDTEIATVEYAKVNADGTLGTWASTSSLNSTWGGLSGVDGAIYKGYMYITGGNNSSDVAQSETQYAQINANGTLGAWTATTSFTTARYFHSSVAANGYLYVIGGHGGSGGYFTDVQAAPINSNGTVGTWAYTSPLPVAVRKAIVTSYNGYIYLYSGETDAGVLVGTNVWYAPMNADGSIGDWQMSVGSTFSTARASAAGGIYNGYMYLLGGGTSSFNSDVQYAPVSVMARKGQYTKQIAINAKTINSITFNGVLPGLGSVAYTAFSANGTVVASGKSSDGVNIIGTACATSASSAAYLFISVVLDDTTNGGSAFADASSANAANITDITVNYESAHPLPSIRLRHGQTLQTGALSPLDTCIAP